MPGFMLEGRNPAQSFVLPSYAMHELRNQHVFIGFSSSISSKQLLCFVQGHGQKREQKHATIRTLMSFITIPLY